MRFPGPIAGWTGHLCRRRSASPVLLAVLIVSLASFTTAAAAKPEPTAQPAMSSSMPGVIAQSGPAPAGVFPKSSTTEPSPEEMLALLHEMQTLLNHMQATTSSETRVPVLTPTPMPTATPPAPIRPGAAVQSPSMTQMVREMQDLYRLMQATMQTMQVLMQKQPTDDEMAAMQAQLNVVARRMAQLLQQLRAAEPVPGAPAVLAPSVKPAPTGGPSHAQVGELISVMQQAGELLQSLLADPTVDDATLAQVQAMLGQLQSLMGQVQGIVGQIHSSEPDASSAGSHLGSTGHLGHEMAETPKPGPSASRTPTAGGSGANTLDSIAEQVQGITSMMNSMMSMMSGMMGGMGGSGGTASGGSPPPGNMPGLAGESSSALMRQAQAGGVTVTVHPLNLRTPGLATLDFYLRLEAPSVDLSQDLLQLAVLRPPSGTELPAARWIGPRGGNHVEGTLVFSARDAAGASVLPATGRLTLVIRNLDGVNERTFSWDVSKTP